MHYGKTSSFFVFIYRETCTVIHCEIINNIFPKMVAVSRETQYNILGRKFGLTIII